MAGCQSRAALDVRLGAEDIGHFIPDRADALCADGSFCRSRRENNSSCVRRASVRGIGLRSYGAGLAFCLAGPDHAADAEH